MGEARAVRWRVLGLFAVGLLISAVMIARSQVGGDQLNLLARGWLLAAEGVWVPYGNRMSAGGFEPGGFTALLVALPLLVWRDYRAPAVLILLFHAGAYALLDRIVRDSLTPRHRLLFCVAYWLNPWRLYFSGHLWNPNYLLLFGALHAWTAYRLRQRPRFWTSFLHSGAIGLALQLHPSPLLLAVASALLIVWRRLRPHWPGLLCGAAAAGATLVPYALLARENPALLPGGEGFPGYGLLLVVPVLRGVGYWFRYASLALSQKITNFDFAPLLGPTRAWFVEWGLALLRYVAAPLTLAASVLATLWLARRVRRRWKAVPASSGGWLQDYTACLFLAGVISFCLAPTTVMWWQCLPFFHAAVLPLVFWAGALSRGRLAAPVAIGVRVWTALCVVFAVASTFGSPLYRGTGRGSEAVPLAEHRMLHDLGLGAQSDAALGTTAGFRSDVLVDR